MITFKDRAIKAYEQSISDTVRAAEDRKRRDFDVHMTQFVNKLRAIKLLENMPKGWTPKDYTETVEGVTLMFEPVPTQQVYMPVQCSKCKELMRKLPVTDVVSVGRNLMTIEAETHICNSCAAKSEKKEKFWWEFMERGLGMLLAEKKKKGYVIDIDVSMGGNE